MKNRWRITLAFVLVVAIVMVFTASSPRKVDVTEMVYINVDRSKIWGAVTDFEGVFHESESGRHE